MNQSAANLPRRFAARGPNADRAVLVRQAAVAASFSANCLIWLATCEPGLVASETISFHTRSGVLVASVTPGSSGAEAGIRPGDAILEVNRRPVSDVETFRAAMSAVKPSEVVPIQVRRGGGSGRSEYVVLRAPAR